MAEHTLRQAWIREDTLKKIKSNAALDGLSIADYFDKMAENFKVCRKHEKKNYRSIFP